MNRMIKTLVVTLSLVVFSYASLGYLLGKSDDQKSYRSLGVYSEVLQRVQEEYVEEPSIPKVTAGALHGLLESLDAMSSYLSPQEYTEYKKQISAKVTGTVGVALSKRSGYIMIVSVLPDSPGEKAGLHTGDFVESVAGFASREMSVKQANNLLAGTPGTAVKIAVVRRPEAKTEELTLTRAQMGPVHIAVTKLTPDTAYMRVVTLDKGKADEIRAKLVELDKDGVKKLVLDVRGCAIGDDSEGIAVARLFLNSGTITSLKGQTVTKQDFNADAGKQVWKNQVAVLTSNATSGAAEILASAVGGNHRGDVVGERTFGSASEQKLIEFDDGSAIYLTDAFYYTPAGKAIPEEGVVPTAEVTPTAEDAAGFSRVENPPLTPSPNDDAILTKALDILNGAHKVAERHQPALRRSFAAPVIG